MIYVLIREYNELIFNFESFPAFPPSLPPPFPLSLPPSLSPSHPPSFQTCITSPVVEFIYPPSLRLQASMDSLKVGTGRREEGREEGKEG
jgi:hypothetical protein